MNDAGLLPDPEPEPQLPPDPAAYDSERSVHARKRGLSAPYIAGGRDPNPEVGKAEERHYLRLLIVMVIILILAAFVVGLVATLLGFNLGATTE